MRSSIKYQEVCLTPKHEESAAPDHPLSYSRCLGKTSQHYSSIHNFFHHPSPTQTPLIHTNHSFFDFTLKQDDMLKVLRGKNYLMSSDKKLQFIQKKKSSNHPQRSLLKHKSSKQNPVKIQGGNLVKKGSPMSKELQHQNNKRQQNERKYLERRLVVQKWLNISKICQL